MDSSIVEVSPASLGEVHEPLSGRSKALRIVFLVACACLLISVSALVIRNAEETAVKFAHYIGWFLATLPTFAAYRTSKSFFGEGRFPSIWSTRIFLT
jgi:hypothetical protein